ncbi:hypothetical protein HMPREF0063_12383 [Aeromicrobium marinum DSM 15272]|uniref:ABC transporter permease n=1 Tax=Aeromicrobium marinum DSM 15272 TaxID=585531 RepID=E2SD71_9ACTN|nr:ABC transporter permease subunit [Aeromicrobium marinum]EFQ83174.1 hypothetical protein HMPREF0063_12383 [Aeromicrobium marinum DSM 15272]
MSTTHAPVTVHTDRPGVPLSRIVRVELRKMFNTRSGFWLMMSIAITALLATASVILFAPDSVITYNSFGSAIGVPFGVILPVVAILSVTSEWSQRTGLITFTLVPHRGQVVAAKGIAAVIVAVASMLFSFGVGALGNVVGAAVNGVDTVWNVTVTDMLLITLGNVLGLLIGFMLGVVIRNSAGAIVGYFAYAFVVPTIFGILAFFQDWFDRIQPWIDFGDAQVPLFETSISGEEWAQLGVSGLIWLVVPLTLGVMAVLRSEVK